MKVGLKSYNRKSKIYIYKRQNRIFIMWSPRLKMLKSKKEDRKTYGVVMPVKEIR